MYLQACVMEKGQLGENRTKNLFLKNGGPSPLSWKFPQGGGIIAYITSIYTYTRWH